MYPNKSHSITIKSPLIPIKSPLNHHSITMKSPWNRSNPRLIFQLSALPRPDLSRFGCHGSPHTVVSWWSRSWSGKLGWWEIQRPESRMVWSFRIRTNVTCVTCLKNHEKLVWSKRNGWRDCVTCRKNMEQVGYLTRLHQSSRLIHEEWRFHKAFTKVSRSTVAGAFTVLPGPMFFSVAGHQHVARWELEGAPARNSSSPGAAGGRGWLR